MAKRKVLLSFACVGLLLASCSKNKPVVDSVVNRRVSVSSSGVEVKNYQAQLVHRLRVTPSEIDSVFNKANNQLRLPYQLRKEQDVRGGTKGLRVVSTQSPAGVPFWGLLDRDLVTAIGTKPAESPQDFWNLRRELLLSKQATMTLERGDSPHKIIFFLEGL